MNTYDPKKAQRVWDRVQGNREPEQPKPDMNLQAMIMNEWITAATYLALARQVPPREMCVLQRMAREDQGHGACLKGIYTLITGMHPTVRSLPVSQGDIETVLRRCYGREMQCLAQYEARRSDPEYGQVFARLADQEREHCRLLLELLGRHR